MDWHRSYPSSPLSSLGLSGCRLVRTYDLWLGWETLYLHGPQISSASPSFSPRFPASSLHHRLIQIGLGLWACPVIQLLGQLASSLPASWQLLCQLVPGLLAPIQRQFLSRPAYSLITDSKHCPLSRGPAHLTWVLPPESKALDDIKAPWRRALWSQFC